jgi:murein DD-endopeptidase MepM/ murein hydrolase activator NlpD
VYHVGVDIVVDEGTDVRAIADGEVTDVNDTKTSGWSNDGTNSNIGLFVRHHSAERGDFVALYGHVLRDGAKKKGDRVKAGETIARIGHWEGGDHLHFGILSPGLPGPLASGYGRWKIRQVRRG